MVEHQRPSGVTLIAIYEFVTAAVLLICTCTVLVFAMPAAFFAVGTPRDIFSTLIVLGGSVAVLFAFGVASAVVGWGLLQMQPWARIGAIALAIPALFGFPLWTIAAIVILVYLASAEGRAAFGVDAAAQPAPHPSAPSNPPPAPGTESSRTSWESNPPGSASYPPAPGAEPAPGGAPSPTSDATPPPEPRDVSAETAVSTAASEVAPPHEPTEESVEPAAGEPTVERFVPSDSSPSAGEGEAPPAEEETREHRPEERREG